MESIWAVLVGISSFLKPLFEWIIQRNDPENKRLRNLEEIDFEIEKINKKIRELSRKSMQIGEENEKEDHNVATALGDAINRRVFLIKQREKYLKSYKTG